MCLLTLSILYKVSELTILKWRIILLTTPVVIRYVRTLIRTRNISVTEGYTVHVIFTSTTETLNHLKNLRLLYKWQKILHLNLIH